MTASTRRATLTLAGVLFALLLLFQSRNLAFTGRNDFAAFYVGAKLVGTPDLYDAERNRAVAIAHLGGTSEAWRYIRLPFQAALMWPLGLLPYQSAYLAWALLRLAALAGFLALWRIPSRPEAAMFTALCLPVAAALIGGQDVTLSLLWIALAVHWHHREREFSAGLAVSLCAAKPHLFALLPVLMAAQRRWRMLAGLLAGGALWIAVSFAVAGPRWPMELLSAVRDVRVHPKPDEMPNLHGLLWGLPFSTGLEVVLGAVVGALAWHVARRTSFHWGLAVALFGGLLVSHHAYLGDCSILLPAILIVRSQSNYSFMRRLSLFLLTPPFGVALVSPRPWPNLAQLSLLLFLGVMALEVLRKQRSAGPELPVH